ncbi:MAG: nickel pincer cofactor biosynthesis protein LarC [Eubacterium sp.]
MKTLYIECNMGVAGDMLMGALLEVIEDKEEFIKKMNSLGIPKIKIKSQTCVKCGITGTHVSVTINGEEEKSGEHYAHHKQEHIYPHTHEKHHHASMENIRTIVDRLNVSEKIKADIMRIYEIIAEAESQVHGKPVTEVHFHEVGMMDAIADITGCCILMEQIQPEKIVVSPIKTGFGHIHCAHGIMPVPAPATAYILKGIPNSTGNIEGELCTPTGAAIVKYFADQYGYQPEMITDKIGYGMGKKDFSSANCVRVVTGHILEQKKNAGDSFSEAKDKVVELCCNLDDMTPEEIGYAMEVLFKKGAVDVYTTSIGMKKSRPGIMLNVMCRFEEKEEFVKLIFQHTTTIGIREYECNRYVLERTTENISTKYGEIRVKKSEGYGVVRRKMEYEDLRKIAEDNNVSMMDVKKIIK